MQRHTLAGILFGAACLSAACLCSSVSRLPLTWAPTRIHSTLQAVQLATPGADSGDETGRVCVTELSQALRTSENTYLPGNELEADFSLVTYNVQGDALFNPMKVHPIPPKLQVYQDDAAGQRKLWAFFTDIIPAEQRTQLSRFEVFTDGPNNSLGAVEQTDDPRRWMLSMDIQDGANFPDLSTTLVHEFAHLLTLNDTQVTPDMPVFDQPNDAEVFEAEAAGCPTYFLFEGCSRPDSYINQFFQRFWTGLYAEWKPIDAETDEDKQDRDLERFYERHADQFLSTYAATSPEEDIAESFMYFIFTPRPAGEDIAGQKQLFFYEDAGLMDLRAYILSRLCGYVLKP
jgi:hypothetical protein